MECVDSADGTGIVFGVAGIPMGYLVASAVVLLYVLPFLVLSGFTVYRLYGDREHVKKHGKVRNSYLSVMQVVRSTLISFVPIVNLFLVVYVVGEWLLGLPLWRRPMFKGPGVSGGSSRDHDHDHDDDDEGYGE